MRGDDISFSLANRFDTATLNGVMSFQEDFAAKESPQTLYLDLRNHLHHHLTQAGMQISARRSANIALRFLARSLIRMHYDSAAAQLLAWEDVMEAGAFHPQRRHGGQARSDRRVGPHRKLGGQSGGDRRRRRHPARPGAELADEIHPERPSAAILAGLGAQNRPEYL